MVTTGGEGEMAGGTLWVKGAVMVPGELAIIYSASGGWSPPDGRFFFCLSGEVCRTLSTEFLSSNIKQIYYCPFLPI